MKNLARNSKDLEKLDLLLNCKDSFINKSVPDPYYGGEDGFYQVFELLDEAIEHLIQNNL